MPRTRRCTAFIDAHREAYGLQLTCQFLATAPSGYYKHRARLVRPECRAAPSSA